MIEGVGGFIEVHVSTAPIETCESRDRKVSMPRRVPA
jgi:hypothetical protein